MALTAPVADGKVQQAASEAAAAAASKTDSSKKASSSLDKDSFLQLLVAQMKYQDPLEPTSNTEYISQFAQFSELEEMQNLGTSMDTQRASSLVGQYVTMKVTSQATGETSLVGGKVDYVAIENGKAFLNIAGQNYSIDDLDSVVDEKYLNAYTLANEFVASLTKLPTLGNLTTGYKDVIENLRSVYNDMSDYEKTFVTPAQLESLAAYEAKLRDLLTVEEGNKENEDDAEEEPSVE